MNRKFRFVALLVVLFSIALAQNGFAQTKVEVGETVKFLHFSKWTDAKVVAKEKKQVQIEYTWVSKPHLKVLNRNEIRRLYEVDAMDFGRNWESAAGTFKVDAALKEIRPNEVVLIKLDLSEITVRLDKLCSKDNSYVKKLKRDTDRAIARGEIPAITPKLPEIEKFDNTTLVATTSTIASGAAEGFGPLGATPERLTKFTQNGYGFRLFRKRQKLVAVIPVGGEEQWVLMSAREDNWWNKNEDFQSQVYWVSFAQKKVVSSVPVTPEDFVIDYNADHNLMLSFHEKVDDSPDHYTLWKMEPGSEEPPIALVRWDAPSASWRDNRFARIVDERTVIAKTKRHTYSAWDIVEKKKVYELQTKSFFDAPVVISPNRKYLLAPEDGQISVFDSATGQAKFVLPISNASFSGVNINAAGTKIAALTGSSVFVWDLNSGDQAPTVYPAPLMGSPFTSRIEWIGDDQILGESHSQRILYRLSEGLPIWSYKMDSTSFWNDDPMKNMVVNGMFFYVATPDWEGNAVAVGAVNLPGPKVDEVASSIDRDSLLILKPGVAVGLSLGSVTDSGRVTKWLTEKAKANGWVLDDSSDIRIHAEMGVGETQTIQYRKIGSFGSGDAQSVSFRPNFSNLKIKQGEMIIFETGTSTGPPSMITGDNFQKEVNKYQGPQLEFFETVKLEREIIHPKFSRGFGVSNLGLNGIEVVSTTPPGREDDPTKTAAETDEDRKKEKDDQHKSDGGDSQGGEAPK